VLEGPSSNVRISLVPARGKTGAVPSVRLLVEDAKKGTRDYHIRLLWALKAFADFLELERFLQDAWAREYRDLLRAVQLRGVGFEWSETVLTRLKRAMVPADVVAKLTTIQRLECDREPFSVDDFFTEVRKSAEQYASRAAGEIASRGVTEDAAKELGSVQNSLIWTAAIKSAVRSNIRPHNRPKDW
jgi:hypothetical protein